MRVDYQDEFFRLKSALFDLHGECVSNSELSAEFAFPNNWKLRFDGERYGPGTFLYFVEPDRGREFHVWLLMLVFNDLWGKACGVLNFSGQLEFIRKESVAIFEKVALYEGRYDEINKVF